MEFNVILKIKTSEGEYTTLNFVPTEEGKKVCDCNNIITKVPISAQGYFVDKEYTITISDKKIEVISELA